MGAVTQGTERRRVGRPRAASRDLLEEAACELFLERGYAATSVADITSRAGVSRSTFFNYVEAKSDLLWARFDDAVVALRARLADGADVAEALRELAAGLPAENVAMAFAQGEAMGLGEELRLAAVRRLADVRDALTPALRAAGTTPLVARARAGAYAGCLLAAVQEWSLAGAGRTDLVAMLDEAMRATLG
ncbi:MAG TPA: TetR family transcriptional regulator [Micrococcales bacterium]|nr:TetR family transcriptional regulator [Micrococcales bacterium]